MTKHSVGEQTKGNIIQAAGELAAETGLDTVSTRAIAERSGENIGSIHYHFGGKDGLFEAVVREAMSGCVDKSYYGMVAELDETNATPSALSKLLRTIVQSEVTSLFRSGRPGWHSQVIYQLLQRDDPLYQVFKTEVMNPSMDSMGNFFRCIDPAMTDEEVHLRICILKMPIFAHANYMKAMLKRLNTDTYTEEYLQKMEDLLVRQTQLLLGLPDDLEPI